MNIGAGARGLGVLARCHFWHENKTKNPLHGETETPPYLFSFTVFLMLRLLVKGVFFGVRGAALGVLRLCGRKKPEPEQPPAVPDAAATPVTDAAPDADAESLAEFLAE